MKRTIRIDGESRNIDINIKKHNIYFDDGSCHFFNGNFLINNPDMPTGNLFDISTIPATRLIKYKRFGAKDYRFLNGIRDKERNGPYDYNECEFDSNGIKVIAVFLDKDK
jgi:hypothetical protein